MEFIIQRIAADHKRYAILLRSVFGLCKDMLENSTAFHKKYVLCLSLSNAVKILLWKWAKLLNS